MIPLIKNKMKMEMYVKLSARRHFSNILNAESVFEVDEITKLQPVREQLANSPSKHGRLSGK